MPIDKRRKVSYNPSYESPYYINIDSIVRLLFR